MKTDPEMRIEKENLIVLNGKESEEKDAMDANMLARRARAKAGKAGKEAAKRRASKETTQTRPSNKAAKTSDRHSSVKTANGKSASALQKDPLKSEIYKSLFNSHKSAANKPKAHWVTFDPR